MIDTLDTCCRAGSRFVLFGALDLFLINYVEFMSGFLLTCFYRTFY